MIQRSLPVAPLRSVGFIFIIMLAAVVGCKKQPFSCVPVSGKVMYEDGSLIQAERIRVKFISQAQSADPHIAPREGAADVDGKTGTFDWVTTYVPKDGIIPGEHKVVIQCFTGSRLRTDLVGEEYSNSTKTPLIVQSSQSPFELKVRKPGSRVK
jgi:hypothetical protein